MILANRKTFIFIIIFILAQGADYTFLLRNMTDQKQAQKRSVKTRRCSTWKMSFSTCGNWKLMSPSFSLASAHYQYLRIACLWWWNGKQTRLKKSWFFASHRIHVAHVTFQFVNKWDRVVHCNDFIHTLTTSYSFFKVCCCIVFCNLIQSYGLDYLYHGASSTDCSPIL